MSTEPRSYYGQPILKEPVWTPEIPAYFFLGGLGGASAALALLTGDGPHARRTWATALAALSVSPALLISDLGVPKRFLNMLRMFKVTSPMSVGTWLLSGCATATGVSALHAWTGLFPGAARVARPVAGGLGLPVSTYTGALIAQTAIPVWHEARQELPFLFAAGAAVSAGGAAAALTPVRHAAAARRLTAVGAAAELGVMLTMEQRLGKLAEPYSQGRAATYKRVAHALVMTGALAVTGPGRRSRLAAVAGGAAVLAGAASARWAVFRAGFESARDPASTVGPQRERIAAGVSRGASRRTVPA